MAIDLRAAELHAPLEKQIFNQQVLNDPRNQERAIEDGCCNQQQGNGDPGAAYSEAGRQHSEGCLFETREDAPDLEYRRDYCNDDNQQVDEVCYSDHQHLFELQAE